MGATMAELAARKRRLEWRLQTMERAFDRLPGTDVGGLARLRTAKWKIEHMLDAIENALRGEPAVSGGSGW